MTTDERMDELMCLSIIRRVQEILSDASKWSKTHVGETVGGNYCGYGHPLCVRWSLVGALLRAASDYAIEVVGSLDAIRTRDMVYKKLAENLCAAYPSRCRPSVFTGATFNEHPNTTFADVCLELARLYEQFNGGTVMKLDHLTAPNT